MIKFYKTENEAIEISTISNRNYHNEDLMVVVEGPDDDWAVMSLKDAIDGEFFYSWYC